MTAQAQRGIADQQRKQRGSGNPERHRGEHRPLERGGQHRRGIAANRSKGVLPERYLPGVAHEKIEAGDEDGVEGSEAQHRDEVAARDEGVTHQHGTGQPAQRRCHAR